MSLSRRLSYLALVLIPPGIVALALSSTGWLAGVGVGLLGTAAILFMSAAFAAVGETEDRRRSRRRT